MTSYYSAANAANRGLAENAAFAEQARHLSFALGRRAERMAHEHGERLKKLLVEGAEIGRKFAAAAAGHGLLDETSEYFVDAGQRAALTLDTLRERANNDATHEAAGTPPVLIYAHEVVIDGRSLPRPVNYLLLKILPPEGVKVFDWKRPYMIIDPRAGHGAGIGGFKADSQVGVALHDGHPVYFVVFRPHPEPEQTLADVMRAEAAFVAEIHRLHPDAPKPIIVGNCQGGWATLALAAANPDITGPLVLNGAPVAYWSGRLGENPMRYNGGLFGGALPALLLSDLNDGEFDGANLVANFEMLNPGRNFFGKYYDLFANPERVKNSFLDFERWWGGYHFLNEAEIHWIVEQLFVGNRLSRGEAILEHGRRLDLKAIRSPIIVFASWGDNITPPQQALNWIVDTYIDEHEIRIRGQRIIYMVHEKVGHLGIFVSSSIAKKEHAEVESTLKTIEALPPGLYEMTIDEAIGEGLHARFSVSFHERKISDILAIDENDRSEERDFPAIARLSELSSEIYDLTARPWVQALVNERSAAAMRAAHPSRWGRRMFGDDNPLMKAATAAAERVRNERKPASVSNPWLAWEKWWAEATIEAFDLWRDGRDAACETAFLTLWGSPFLHRIGATHAFERTRKDRKELRFLPEVQAILARLDRGGFAAAVIRMAIMLVDSRGGVRRDRLERSANVLAKDEPFVSLGAKRNAAIIREQSIIVEFEPEEAIETLPELLPGPAEREKAIDLVEFVAGAVEEMEPHTIQALQHLRATLGLPPLALPDMAHDPLEDAARA